jgi:hypothetical protein
MATVKMNPNRIDALSWLLSVSAISACGGGAPSAADGSIADRSPSAGGATVTMTGGNSYDVQQGSIVSSMVQVDGSRLVMLLLGAPGTELCMAIPMSAMLKT